MIFGLRYGLAVLALLVMLLSYTKHFSRWAAAYNTGTSWPPFVLLGGPTVGVAIGAFTVACAAANMHCSQSGRPELNAHSMSFALRRHLHVRHGAGADRAAAHRPGPLRFNSSRKRHLSLPTSFLARLVSALSACVCFLATSPVCRLIRFCLALVLPSVTAQPAADADGLKLNHRATLTFIFNMTLLSNSSASASVFCLC